MMKYVQMIVMPILVPVLVGIGSAAMTGSVMMVRLEERMANLERSVLRHETETTKAVERHEAKLGEISKRDTEQEQRLVKSESIIESVRGDLFEIKSDIKTLIRTRPTS